MMAVDEPTYRIYKSTFPVFLIFFGALRYDGRCLNRITAQAATGSEPIKPSPRTMKKAQTPTPRDTSRALIISAKASVEIGNLQGLNAHNITIV